MPQQGDQEQLRQDSIRLNERAAMADYEAAAYELAASNLEQLQVDLFIGQPSSTWWSGGKAESVNSDINVARRAVNAEIIALRDEARRLRNSAYALRAQAYGKAVAANDLDTAAAAAAAAGPR